MPSSQCCGGITEHHRPTTSFASAASSSVRSSPEPISSSIPCRTANFQLYSEFKLATAERALPLDQQQHASGSPWTRPSFPARCSCTRQPLPVHFKHKTIIYCSQNSLQKILSLPAHVQQRIQPLASQQQQQRHHWQPVSERGNFRPICPNVTTSSLCTCNQTVCVYIRYSWHRFRPPLLSLCPRPRVSPPKPLNKQIQTELIFIHNDSKLNHSPLL